MKPNYHSLRELRKAVGLRQSDLGSADCIVDIEAGRKLPGHKLAHQIVDRLAAAGAEITVLELMTICRVPIEGGTDA